MNNELIVIEKVNPIEVFTGNGLDPLLEQIKREVSAFEPNLETVTGRKEVASMAHKVSKSKVVIDNLGKDLVADWRQKSKQVDAARKSARDFLDNLKEEVRKPLTEWEEEEKARVEAEQLKQEIKLAHESAIAENDLFDRQRDIERKEAELAKQEEERKAKELSEQQERERVEREERLKKEAAEKAKREAEESAKREREELQRKEREAIEAKERAEREKIAAEERSKLEKQQAIENEQRKAKEEAERVERERLEKQRIEKEEAERKAANKRHQGNVNREAKESLVAAGFDNGMAKDIVVLIAQGKIKNVTINY